MKRFPALAVACTILSALVLPAAPVSAGPGDKVTNVTIVSGAADHINVAVTVFQPAAASAASPVPVILHSHGWGGSRTTTISAEFQKFLDAGFGIVSIDQRGFGQSDGEANIQDPDLETEDVASVIDYVASLDWVAHNVDINGNPILTDPVLGAIGGSYGGAYQTMTALDEVAENGATRFDALAPEITWYDLNESLAPQDVVRTTWVTALFAVGATALPQYVHKAFVYGAATGFYPDGTILGTPNENVPNLKGELVQHAPKFFSDRGIKLSIPVIQRQGISDNLFNLNQGLHIFRDVLTDEARARSLFVGYNNGHALPNVAPLGTPAAGNDRCSGDWTQLRINFFKSVFAGGDPTGLLPARYNLTDVGDASCIRFNGTTTKTIKVNEGVDPTGSNGMIATAGIGAPLHLPVTAGEAITIAGIPHLKGTVYSAALDTRVFFGLAIGATPATAQVIQNNLMPLRRLMPSLGEDFDIELPGVAASIPAGQNLYLTITPVSDMFFAHGSRTPGGMLLTDLELILPTP